MALKKATCHPDRDNYGGGLCGACYSMKRRKDGKVKNWFMLRHYGITKEQYLSLLAAQGGVCAICGIKPDRDLDVDHNHVTSKVRGLLCTNCNNGIGRFKDNPHLVQLAANYLLLWQMNAEKQ